MISDEALRAALSVVDDILAREQRNPLGNVGEQIRQGLAALAAPVSPSRICDICGNIIVKDSHGGDHPSPGDHDPAPHVTRTYGVKDEYAPYWRNPESGA